MDGGERLDATGRCLKKAGVVTFRQVSVANHFRRIHQVFAVPHDLLFLGLLFSSFAIVSRARPFFVPLCFFFVHSLPSTALRRFFSRMDA